MQRRQRAGGSNFEDCSKTVGPAKIRGPVEVSIGSLDQPRYGGFAVGAIALGTKIVKGRQGATRCDFEDCTAAVGSA